MTPLPPDSEADRQKAEPAGAARGFTLVEILVALAIFAALVGALVPLGYQVQASMDERETREKLENIKRAMIGPGPGEASGES